METSEVADKILFLVAKFPDKECKLTDKDFAHILSVPEKQVADAINKYMAFGLLSAEVVSETVPNDSRKLQKDKDFTRILWYDFLKACPLQDIVLPQESCYSSIDIQRSCISINNNKRDPDSVDIPNICTSQAVGPDGPAVRKPRKVISKEIKDEIQTKKTSPAVKDVVALWNGLELRKCRIGPTKTWHYTARSIEKARRGELHRIEEIKHGNPIRYGEMKRAIRRFHLAVKNPYYDPVNGSPYHQYLSEVTLGQFFLNLHSKTAKNKSLLLFYMNHKPEFIKQEGSLPDKYPMVTDILKDFFIEKVLGGIAPPYFLAADEDKFRSASIKTIEFFNNNQEALGLSFLGINQPEQYATLVCEALEKDVGDVSKLTPGYFNSELTFHRRVPAYLKKQGMVKKDDYDPFNLNEVLEND